MPNAANTEQSADLVEDEEPEFEAEETARQHSAKVAGETLARIEEWKVLRSEIARKQGLVERILIGMAGVTFAIIAYGLKECHSVGISVCGAPALIATVVYFWTLNQTFSGFRIAGYIAREIEPRVAGLTWESWLKRHQELFSAYRLPQTAKLLTASSYFLSLLAVCLKYYLIRIFEPANVEGSSLLFGITLFGIIAVACVSYVGGRKAGAWIKEVHRAMDPGF